MIGALFSAPFVKYGKLNMIILLNVILMTSVSLAMIENIYVIAIARFFWGLSAGSYTFFAPRYLNEFAPLELRPILGGVPALMLTTGIALPAVLSVALPVDPVVAHAENPNDFYVK